MRILDHYAEEKKRFLNTCIQCGLCAEKCPVVNYTDNRGFSYKDMQEDVFDFMETGNPNRNTYTKAFACMECFQCTAGLCPHDLNPMLINECIKGEYISKGLVNQLSGDPKLHDSDHRVLASAQVSAADYNRITRPSEKKHSRYVFFPGCNVYFQPDKILNALDIMDVIGDDYAFLPGLDYCCGDSFFFTGNIQEGGNRAQDLATAISEFQPEAVILWCPTCLCRFGHTIVPALDVPFTILSFPQYLARNMDKLSFTETIAGTVTLHEACKSAYTGLDLNGPRDVLNQLPGVTVKEMAHHGKQTKCCGSGAICWFPESFHQVREERLNEAAQTGADRLATVCHYCEQVFAAEEKRFDFSVTSYVSMVAEAMGIHRENKYKKYALWKDLDRIIEDADATIRQSPFEKEQVIAVLRSVFIG